MATALSPEGVLVGGTVVTTTVVLTEALPEDSVDLEEDEADLEVSEVVVVSDVVVVGGGVVVVVVVVVVVEGMLEVVVVVVVCEVVVVVVVLLCLLANRTSSLATAGFSECTCSIAVLSLLKTPSLNFGLRELRTARRAASLVSSSSAWNLGQSTGALSA